MPHECGEFRVSALSPPSGPPALRGDLHRVNDLLIARAPAQVARQRFADRLLAGRGVVLQQIRGRHDQSRRAEPALHRTGLDEGFLDRMQPVALTTRFYLT